MLPSRDPSAPAARRNIRAASTLDDSRRKREQFTVKIRKEKREAMLQKRRAGMGSSAAAAPAAFGQGPAFGANLLGDPQQDVPKTPEEIASMKSQVRAKRVPKYSAPSPGVASGLGAASASRGRSSLGVASSGPPWRRRSAPWGARGGGRRCVLSTRPLLRAGRRLHAFPTPPLAMRGSLRCSTPWCSWTA